MVEHRFREAGAGGSNPLTPTNVSAAGVNRHLRFISINIPQPAKQPADMGAQDDR